MRLMCIRTALIYRPNNCGNVNGVWQYVAPILIYRLNNCGNVKEYRVHYGENMDQLSFRMLLFSVAFR